MGVVDSAAIGRRIVLAGVAAHDACVNDECVSSYDRHNLIDDAIGQERRRILNDKVLGLDLVKADHYVIRMLYTADARVSVDRYVEFRCMPDDELVMIAAGGESDYQWIASAVLAERRKG